MSDLSKKHYTTGEAAEILGLSASTVIRKFDRGELAGKRHPITGKRLIARAVLEQFLATHDLPAAKLVPEKRRILIADDTPSDAERLRLVFSRDRNLTADVVNEGCEVCGRTVSWRPHLAIVNIELPDMRGRDVVRCLRNLPLAQSLYIALASPPGASVSREDLNELDADAYFPKPWRYEALRMRVRGLIGLDPDAGAEADIVEHRRWPRRRADWAARVEVRVDDGKEVVDVGRARIRDISEGGAFLYDLELDHAALPAKPFTLGIAIVEGELRGYVGRARPVRLDITDRLGVGVHFDEVDMEKVKQLKEVAAEGSNGTGERS